jgi:AraC-like DNA-binding protein
MSYPVLEDIIPLLRRLAEVLHVVAMAHDVSFHFESSIDRKEFYFHEEILIADLAHLLCRIIANTPPGHEVTLRVTPLEWPHADGVRIRVSNTGACLLNFPNILSDIHHTFLPSRPQEGGAFFELELYAQRLGENEEDGAFLNKVNNLIQIHLDKEHFDVPTLCNALGISRNHLYRRLPRLVYMSPKQYILSVRLSRAREYLETHGWTVGEVAYRLGFRDESHFIRVFKRHFGCTPGQIKSDRHCNKQA